MILVDVDGTMVDSVPDLSWCIDNMMLELGMKPRGIDAARLWVGNGVEKLVHRALTKDLDLEADEQQFIPAISIFRQLYADNTSKRSVVYEGVKPALTWFKQNGFKLGCVTNKAEQFTIPLLQDKGLLDFFTIVISGDSLPKKKPDPMPLLHVADYFNVKAEDSLMIGDSISDVKASRSAGFNIATMTYGYNHGEDIRDAQPDIVVDRMDQLIDIIDGL